ncbi:RNA-binding protein 34 [Xyrichtys novacula]|uniref:RNA-binding protein 34 n=1 Tax=Xyrichtys novacula TaxID=13765 RepID=A0AAV1EVU6_XYRNO|nr:RNA-binding protein 34 [Xyrichtys novacula]
MKKKLKQSGEPTPEQQSSDYVVGQVSGSLFSGASGSSLSSLFSTAAPAAPLLFQPVPKPVQKSAKENEQQTETLEVKGQQGEKEKKKKSLKLKSEAEEKLEDRESGLQKADEDEQGQEKANKEKKKKRKAPEENDVEQWVMKRQKKRAFKEEEKVRSKRTVFVGNLPIGCTKKTLQTFFKEKGSIESIRFRSLVREDPSMSRKVAVIQRKSHPKKQSMNAYIVFKDEEGVTRALERNGTEIEKDYHIRVDRVTDNSSHNHKRSVFVGNLSFEINELAFRQHFEECGTVEGVRLVRDKNSGMGKGFGYVLFQNADSVQLALELDGSKLEGRSIRVKRSVKKEKLKKTDSKGNTGRAGKGPAKGPMRSQMRGSGREQGGGRGGFKPSRKFPGNQQRATKSPGSFKGEMTNPNKKSKKKGLKKKLKPKKSVHI